jgi:hypothetical protein
LTPDEPMEGTGSPEPTPVLESVSVTPAVSTSLLCIGLAAGAIECFWRSAQVDRNHGHQTDLARRRWRLTGAALIVAALGLVRRPLGAGRTLAATAGPVASPT